MKGQAEAGPFRASAEVENVEASHLGLEPQLAHQLDPARDLGGLLGRHLGLEADPGVAHVEIIFFSTPTPAATARSYSSGTVAESWSAIPVESKTVTWSSD